MEIDMKIVTNTAALLSPEEGKEHGIQVLPVSVTVGDRSFRDYVDIDTDAFTVMLQGKEKVVSSQPAIGDVLEAVEDCEEEVIMLTVGDGLSGEYMSAMGICNTLPNKEKIHVIDSGSLGGVLRYLAVKAAEMRAKGMTAQEMIPLLMTCARSSVSYVIPADFQYLRKSGRIHQLTSKIGGVLNLLPVLTQSEDRKRITLLKVRRTWKSAVGVILNHMKENDVNEDSLIHVLYADRKELAQQVKEQVLEFFPHTETEIRQLPPSLVTHGGPGCIVLQSIHKLAV